MGGAIDGVRILRAIGARLRPYAPALIATSVIGTVAVRAILARAGEPAAPLDDAFIHLQYARRLAEGHFFSYVPGEGYSSGATSLLWPLLLAPFHLIGLRGLSLLYVTWIFGALAHAALAVETYRVARRLAGPAAAAGAGAMCSLFGAFTWFAWSGMETVPLAWILMRTARVAGAFCEPERAASSQAASTPIHLIALGIAAPLIRPEGAIASLIAAAALALSPRTPTLRGRLPALAPLAGPLIIPMLHLAFAGHAASSTATVKWMIGNPYYKASSIWYATAANARLLLTNLIDGGDWTAVFLPERASIPILLGAALLPIAAIRRRVPLHAVFVAMVALGALIPCTYLSFLWNRLRYIWPFSPAWFVLVACFAREAGDLARRFGPRLTFVTPLLMGGFAGALALKLPWTVQDLAQSASAISRQQVALGRWAAEHLPAGARIGVNDTGAIAYFGERRTFDVVGLTTEGEARYWIAGAGSRFEHYEKLPRERLPTHFMVYPHWMACAPVLGAELTRATVTDQSILGGVTMVAHEARWDLLGSGALPIAPPAGLALTDEIDIADIESERAHAFDLTGASDGDCQAILAAPEENDDGTVTRAAMAEGGRLHRTADRFAARIPAGKRARLVMRLGVSEPLTVAVSIAGKQIGTLELDDPPGPWTERDIELPASASADPVPIEVRLVAPEKTADERPTFHSFHYWIYASP